MIRRKSYLLLILALMAVYGSLFFLITEGFDTNDTNQLLQTVSASESLAMDTEFFDLSQDIGKLTVRYFYLKADEKSGDAIFIKSPNGKTMLLDAGMVNTGPQLNEYLEKLGVDTIDIAVATHPHHDHIGGYETIFQEKPIGTFFLPNVTHTTNTYHRFIELMEEKGINGQYLYAGDQFYLDDDVKVEVLSPEREDVIKARSEKSLTTPEINNLSLVLKMTYQETTFLFTGDIYKKQEKALLKTKAEALKADYLHAPHHGDRTSSSQAFIDAVNPEVTVINANILQSKKIAKRYQKSGSDVYITSSIGHIRLELDE